MTVYEFAIANVATYIRNGQPKDVKGDVMSKKEVLAFDGFEASSVLAVAFMKSKEEVLTDIVKATV